MKRSSVLLGRLGSAAVVAAVVAATVLGGTASASATSAPAAASRPSDGLVKVIVTLKNQHPEAPASKAGAGHRAAVLGGDQAPVRSQIAALGGTTTHAYATVNAVAATVPADSVPTLSTDPSVAGVVPDLIWRLTPRVKDGATAGTQLSPPTQKVCPTDAAKPLLEPEALALTHTASDDPNALTARALGYDGAGVKVGFIADGLDIDQPDFIRADGSHVITDYQDFSGDGTNAPSDGAEAFGDASSIAAQGRVAYDLSTYVSAAHPLPAGCTIRVQGMAPGASMVALKVFSNALLTAPTSTIIQAIDWAVNVDHVDVLNESFGSNPYPDNAEDPISLFNHDAVDAGVTVVASTGDSGSGNTSGTGSTDPWVIGAGASTSEQIYAQNTFYGFQLGNGRWTSNQLSSLSSGGISQTRRVPDLLAPGDLNWAVCSDQLDANGDPLYGGCSDDNSNPTNLLNFGGTSESSPFTAGAAALVIQSFRKAHAGASPTPQQIRQILDSSADDLGLPADLQGAGLLNSYRAVQLAASVDHAPAGPVGSGLLLSDTQTDAVAGPGQSVTKQITVSNQGVGVQRVTAQLRAVDEVTGRQTQTVTLPATTPTTFVDGYGITRKYVTMTFKVPVGTDRLAATISWPGPAGKIVRISLLDPQKTYSGYSLPQGTGNFGRIELHDPAPGTWTAIVWTGASAAGYTGPTALTTTDYVDRSAGAVTPSSFILPPGGKQTLTIRTTAPQASAVASSLVLTGRFGAKTTASFVVQAVQKVRPDKAATFSGTFSTGNGRDYSPAQTETYLFDVPAGARDLDVSLAQSGTPANPVVAHLSDPSGEPIDTTLNQRQDSSGTVVDNGLQIEHANPVPGVWQLTVELENPVAGAALPQHFSGVVALNRVRVSTKGIPNSRRTVISKKRGSIQTITIHNTGPAPRQYFVDARLLTDQDYPLVATQAADPSDPFTATIALPLNTETVPAWLVPTQTRRLTVGAAATDPITFDLMPLDNPTALNAPSSPDIESSTGTSATATHTAHPVASALWAAFPSLIGPTPADGADPGQTSMQAVATTKAFYRDVTSSTGDPLLGTVDPSAPGATPVTIPAGGEATITVHLTPSGRIGSAVQGFLYVDTLQPTGVEGMSSYTDESAALPFHFTIGG